MRTDATGTNALMVLPKALIFVSLVVAISIMSVGLWGEKPDTVDYPSAIVQAPDMTVEAFGVANDLKKDALKALFDLEAPADLQKPIAAFGIPLKTLAEKAKKIRALEQEHESKNWFKIPLKFGLWFAFLIGVYLLLRRNRVTSKNRKWLYLGSAAVFGIVLGADPSPMGTVKDAIALFGAEGVIFPPRMIALSVFLLTVLLANKMICAWGCQFGVLQDFLFRLNRNAKDRKGRLRQYKIPFAVTNTFRILFFGVFTAVAFLWAYDLVGLIDPFKIFKPLSLETTGIVFLGAILVASLFVYRPWCHLFCPFGLVGWMVEKISVAKINVDYGKCEGCLSCVSACPSDSMNAILKQDRIIPDCFACNSCVEACPSGAISFRIGRRAAPPEGKFRDLPEENS